MPHEQAPAFSGILIPGFSGRDFQDGINLYFHPGIFWKNFGISFFAAISNQFREFVTIALVFVYASCPTNIFIVITIIIISHPPDSSQLSSSPTLSSSSSSSFSQPLSLSCHHLHHCHCQPCHKNIADIKKKYRQYILFTNTYSVVSNKVLPIFAFSSMTKTIFPKVTKVLAWKYFDEYHNHTTLHLKRWRAAWF